MIQLRWQNAMPARMARKKNHFASGELAGEKIVGRRAERGFNFHPFLPGETFNVIQSAAANDSNSVIRHARVYISRDLKSRREIERCAR